MSDSAVLYRKYRASNFDEMIGNDNLKSILINTIKDGNVPHSFLFCGPRGTGKTSLARIIAKAVNCHNFSQGSDCCNTCESCMMINQGAATDIIEMDAASNRGIEEIRTLKENINFLPSSLKYKVYIIDEVHMLTKEAFNALLKTLEEPPKHVIFILATTEPHKIPMTILSRVQRYDLSLASKDNLLKKLNHIIANESAVFDDQTLEMVYKISGGSFRDAESILGKLISSSPDKKVTYSDASKIMGIFSEELFEALISQIKSNNLQAFVQQVEDSSQNIIDYSTFISQFIEFCKNKLTTSSEDSASIMPLINTLIDLKFKLKEFEDQKTLFIVSMLKLFQVKSSVANNTSNIIPTVVEQKNDVPTTNITESQTNKAEEIKLESTTPKPVEQPVQQSDSGLKSSIRAKLKDSRLSAIIESSDLIIENKKLIIKNQYAFNLKYIGKPECLSALKQAAEEYDASEISLENGEKNESQQANTASTNSNSYQQDATMNSETTPTKNIDNTNLVEDLLG